MGTRTKETVNSMVIKSYNKDNSSILMAIKKMGKDIHKFGESGLLLDIKEAQCRSMSTQMG